MKFSEEEIAALKRVIAYYRERELQYDWVRDANEARELHAHLERIEAKLD